MDPRLAAAAHSLGRLAWMRSTDLEVHRSAGSELLEAREGWRVEREGAVFAALDRACKAFAADPPRPAVASAAAIADEAFALAAGVTEQYLRSHPLQALAPGLLDAAAPHMKNLVTGVERAGEVAAVARAVLDAASGSSGSPGYRTGLEVSTRAFLVACYAWQRAIEGSASGATTRPGAPPSLSLAFQKLVARQRAEWTTSFEALQRHGMVKRSPSKNYEASHARGTMGHTARSTALLPVPPPRLELAPKCTPSGLGRLPTEAAAAVIAKWAPQERLVRRMQGLLRHKLMARRRRGRGREAQVAASTKVLRSLAEQMPALTAMVDLVVHLRREDERAADFYANEERAFNEQFRAYVRRLTHYHLHECPLDNGWIARYVSAPGAEVGGDEEARGGGSRKLVYTNTSTGRTQDEHPNMLKVVAAKNRQLLKASAARHERQRAMQQHVAAVNELRAAKLPQLEAALAHPLL